MNIKILLITILLLPLSGLSFDKQISSIQIVSSPTQVQAKQLDQRAQILAAYLAKYNSPLQYQAQDFIEAADTYGVDWKLVPAISGVESTFGKQSYGFNAWGWGIYGDQTLDFNSWRDGIYTVTEGLKQNYINKGLTNPYAMNKVYAASPTWGAHVAYFLADLEKFSDRYHYKNTDSSFWEAGNSAKLN
ncbi:MAG: glucosaminidase domain-containing protein [Candidatus Daviesbacteria bacterium]|nr:MAG: glucosaminidase domain-containing protein [Candidatus Daviesbacteria bacterium]